MKTSISIAILVAVVATNASAATASLFVGASANIHGAGRATPPAPGGGGMGVAPSLFGFAAGPGKMLTISSVSGSLTLSTALGFRNGPDGNTALPTGISSFGGISGIQHDASGFLVGLFLGPTEPLDPAPPTLDFSASGIGTGFLSLSPEVGQVFFIGDGRTGTGSGSVQRFMVPTAASRLYLGVADAFGYMGLPGQYQDNAGSFTVGLAVVPEPGIGVLACLGFVLMYGIRRAR